MKLSWEWDRSCWLSIPPRKTFRWFDKCDLCKLLFCPCQGFSCRKCRSYNGNKKSAVVHIEEECNVKGKEKILDHLLPFCRGNLECKHLTILWGLFQSSQWWLFPFSGCNLEFSSRAELELHNSSPCFPSANLLDLIYESAEAHPPFPSCIQENPAASLLSPGDVEIGGEESSNHDFFRNFDSSPSPPPASHYEWSASSLLFDTEMTPPLRNPSSSPGSRLLQERQQKPMAQFGLDPPNVRSETQRHDDSKSLGLPASREDEEVTKSLLRGVLARVSLTEDSCSSPDTRRFSCYADLNSYDGAGDNGNDIRPCPKNEQRKSKNHPAIRFPSASSISPSNSTDHCQQDLSMGDLKQDSKGHTFLVLKPLSSLTIKPGTSSPSRSALSSSPTVADADSETESFSPIIQQQPNYPPCQKIFTASNLPSSSSQSEENCIIIPHPSSLSLAPPTPSHEVNFEDGLSMRWLIFQAEIFWT